MARTNNADSAYELTRQVLMSLMNPAPSNKLTTEHIKSHLQKFRLHYSRSTGEFVDYYNK